MYDPSIGRWLEEDPIGFEGGDANLYRYVGNDPTNETDPTGQSALALGRRAKDAILSALGPNSYAVEVGTMKHPDGWDAPLFVILRGTGAPKSAADLNPELDNALGSLGNNRIFYYDAKSPSTLQDMTVNPGKLTRDQRLTIFKANLLRYGVTAKNSIGYQDFEEQGWKEAGLGAVYVQLELQYGNQGMQLLNSALSKGVRIESDNDSFWFTEKEYSNGTIQIAESKRRGLKRATTVQEAAKYLYTLLKDNKENIEEWANRNYNDPTSAAQMSDRMTDPHTGAAMPLHVGGRGGLARGFDNMLTEAASQVQGLMWEYALAGLNVQSSAAARAAQTEREVGVWSTQARQTFQAGEKGIASESRFIKTLLGHNEYIVSDPIKAARTKQSLLDYYKKNARKPSILPVEGLAGAEINTVDGTIKIGKEVLENYPQLADGYLVEELRHFQVLHQKKLLGRALTAAEETALENDVVQFMARPESGFKVFDPKK